MRLFALFIILALAFRVFPDSMYSLLNALMPIVIILLGIRLMISSVFRPRHRGRDRWDGWL